MANDESSDRELLELAAKAAGMVKGIDIGEWNEEENGYFVSRANHEFGYWNPLADDGDALRLAVRLGMLFTYTVDRFEMFQRFYREELDADTKPSDATRRAIVRVAAEIGKAML